MSVGSERENLAHTQCSVGRKATRFDRFFNPSIECKINNFRQDIEALRSVTYRRLLQYWWQAVGMRANTRRKLESWTCGYGSARRRMLGETYGVEARRSKKMPSGSVLPWLVVSSHPRFRQAEGEAL